jgi:hypothetical protein
VKTVGGSYLTLRPLARLPRRSFMTVQTPRARPSARIPVAYRRRGWIPARPAPLWLSPSHRFVRLLRPVHGALSDRRVRRSWRRGPRLDPPRKSKWLGLKIRSCGGTPCVSARASSFSAISHAGHHSVGEIPGYRCAYCCLRRTRRSLLWCPGFGIGRSALERGFSWAPLLEFRRFG